MSDKIPKKPVFQKQQPAVQRRAPARPVYDYEQENKRRGAPRRVDYGAEQPAPNRAGQPQAAPFVNTVPAARQPGPAGPGCAQGAQPQAQSARRPAPPRQRTWHAGPEQEAPLKPRAPLYDQQAERRKSAAPPAAVQQKPPPKKRRRAAPPKKRDKRPLTPGEARRRRIRGRILTGAVLSLLLAAGILFSAAVVFKVKYITVERPDGDTVYTDEEITAAFGQPLGENLFGFDADVSAQNIVAALPYLEGVSVTRRLPDTVILTVTPAQEYAAVNSALGWAVVSSGMKVLRLDSAAPEGLIAVEGAEADNPVPGQALALTEAEKLDALRTVLAKAEAQGLTPVSQVNLTSVREISFLYAGRIRIVLGTVNDLDYKMEWAWRLVTPQTSDSLSETESGTLDVSSRNADGRGQAIWRAGEL